MFLHKSVVFFFVYYHFLLYSCCPSCFPEELPEWERELQQELNDYEVVVEGEDLDDADLENEILQQIEAEAKQS